MRARSEFSPTLKEQLRELRREERMFRTLGLHFQADRVLDQIWKLKESR